MTEIEIDSKEPLKYKIEALEYGDIVFTVRGRKIRIERKTWDDLLKSHQQGRLAIQLTQLKADDAIPILFIEGYPIQLTPRQRRNLLLSIKLDGIIVEAVNSRADLFNRVKELEEYFDTEQHIGLIPYRYSEPKLGALMWIPGIGYKKAKSLLSAWQGSLIDIYNAPKVALAKYLGESTADRFYTSIRKQPKIITNVKDDYKLWD
jgi:ERCC4-type nuclease